MKKSIQFNPVLFLFTRILLLFFFVVLMGKGIFSEEINSSTPVFLHKPVFKNRVRFEAEFFPLGKPVDYFATPLPASTRTRKFHLPSIMGKGSLSIKDLARFLEQNNPKIASVRASEIAKLYVEEAHHEGVNPDVAFSQMCLETGFMKFSGDVKPDQYNFCGLGVIKKGIRGLSFSTMRMGIRAHIQHLKAYASTRKINNAVVDRRFDLVRRGCVKNIYDLNGKWASDKHYSSKIVSLLKRMYLENNL